MTIKRRIPRTAFLFLVAGLGPIAALAGCGMTATDGDVFEEEVVAGDDLDDKSDQLTFKLIPFTDDTSASEKGETRKLFTSNASYSAYFGHKAPPSVNFQREWVLYYSAGVKNTGGYTAEITGASTSNTGVTLKVFTTLTSPGQGCAVTQSLTKPDALAKFTKPFVRPTLLKQYKKDVTKSCGPECVTDADCRLEADYCTGCDCRALSPKEQIPACTGPGVRCLADPCGSKAAVCQAGQCVTAPRTVQCGKQLCPTGMVCCNASCGICTPPGGFCIQLACIE